ncbi:MAG: hypothetical protein PQJ46_15505 [Spirochaetales bacterium]|nr:hypothetical protein [Spirochaetales bacterium]
MSDSPSINILLDSKNPSIRYRTQRDLLNVKPDKELKQKILESRQVQKILSKMHPDGYWLYRNLGAGIDYAMSSSTHFVLSFLAEMGLDKNDLVIDKAVNRYLQLSGKEKWLTGPDHNTHQSCLYAHNLRTFILLGYKSDERIEERIKTLLDDVRFDDGYLCVRDSFGPKTKSCIRGTVKALMAYAELPEYYSHQSCKKTVNYFLKRNIYYKLPDLQEKIRNGMGTVFPFVINCSLLEPLYALSRMGYGSHPALNDAWATLESHLTESGLYILDWFPPSYFRPGKKGEPNEWVTFYALLAKKYCQESGINSK